MKTKTVVFAALAMLSCGLVALAVKPWLRAD